MSNTFCRLVKPKLGRWEQKLSKQLDEIDWIKVKTKLIEIKRFYPSENSKFLLQSRVDNVFK